MRTITTYLSVLIIPFLVAACGTTDSALQDQGHSQSYITGFHDGRHSGMTEAGNNYEQYIKDSARFDADEQYREGWLAGEAEGKTLQREAVTAGTAAAGAATGYSISKEANKAGAHPHKAMKNATKDMDTEAINSLEN